MKQTDTESVVQSTQSDQTTTCGIVALLGRPNAGKSTLLNALVGQKIAAVSSKQQTTRNRIVGIVTESNSQLIFADTPGLHEATAHAPMNRMMLDAAWDGATEADVCVYLVDLNLGIEDEDQVYIHRLIARGVQYLWIIGTKADTLSAERKKTAKEVLRQQIRQTLLDATPPEGKIPQTVSWIVSAKIPDQVRDLRGLLAKALPAGPWLYDPEQLTDRPTSFVIGEMIREQAFRQLNQELPYQLTVAVHKVDFDQNLPRISASIIVGEESHKGMVIGARGATIKRIGTAARPHIESLLGEKVMLDLRVVVDKGWYDRPAQLAKYL